jgi:hypothetical protein
MGRFDRSWVQPSYVIGPVLVAVVIGALTVGAYLAVGARSRDVLAHTATTHAVITSMGFGPPQESAGGRPSYAQWARISYRVGTRALPAQVTLQTCRGVCPLLFRVGQTIPVAYDVRHPSALYYPVPTTAGYGLARLAIAVIGGFAAGGSLIVAVVNLMIGTVPQGERTRRRAQAG